MVALPSLFAQPPGLPGAPLDFHFDRRLLTFSLLISAATILFFGLVPSWRSTRPDVIPALKDETVWNRSSRRWPLRNWLAVGQVAISMTLLACAGVLVESFSKTRTQDLGFARNPLLLVWLSADAKPAEFRQVISAFETLPGVRSVAAAVRAPLSLSSNGMFQRVTFPGRTEFAGTPPFEIKYNAVTANFLNTMGTPVVRGRGLEAGDENPGATSVLINERMAQRFWPGSDPLGKTIAIRGKEHTVVGVVKNAPINEVGEPAEPYLYISYWANFENEVTFMIETRGDPTALAQAARSALKSVDARLDPLSITTENDLIRFSAQRFQITAELAGALGLLGLILTAVGLYGVISYGVSQRTRELGIRMALGADRGDTMRLVLSEVAMVGGVGIVIGLPMALLATRSFSALLFGVSPWDATAFTVAAVVLIGVLMVAGFLPARRATGIDPSSALRST
jgi:putative ABC transport system permease protein